MGSRAQNQHIGPIPCVHEPSRLDSLSCKSSPARTPSGSEVLGNSSSQVADLRISPAGEVYSPSPIDTEGVTTGWGREGQPSPASVRDGLWPEQERSKFVC